MCNTVKQCGVLLLAGGKSSRMGQNKALLEHDGVPMIQRLAEQCVEFPEKLLSSPVPFFHKKNLPYLIQCMRGFLISCFYLIPSHLL